MAGKTFSAEKLNEVLKKIIKLLHEYKITNWFIAYGTLLGIVRGNSCINDDDDIDILIDKNQSDILRKIVTDNNYKYIYNFNTFIKIEIDANLPTIDFYFSKIENENAHDLFENLHWINVFPLKEKIWNEQVLYLPNNYEDKLANIYGDDWRIPRKTKGICTIGKHL